MMCSRSQFFVHHASLNLNAIYLWEMVGQDGLVVFGARCSLVVIRMMEVWYFRKTVNLVRSKVAKTLKGSWF